LDIAAGQKLLMLQYLNITITAVSEVKSRKYLRALTPWSQVLQKPTVIQPFQKSATFYGTLEAATGFQS
jgi:hypothetical protein